jgi:phosphatidylglycerol:prolipoprotein diacylglycerol transferase
MHAICFDLGPFTIRWYGVFMALGFVGALLNWIWQGRRRGYNVDFCSDLIFWVMVSGILGARLAYVLENWDFYSANPAAIIRLDQGGLVFYGGFVMAGVGIVLFAKRRKLNLVRLLDFVLTSVPLAHALGRIGCFLNGCCFGSCTSSAFGVQFPKGSPAWMEHYQEHLINQASSLSCRVHPVQLYESAWNFMLYLGLMVVYRKTERTGLVSALYLMAYAAARFTLEFFRGDKMERAGVGALSIGQVISIPLFLVGAVLLAIVLIRPQSVDGGSSE